MLGPACALATGAVTNTSVARTIMDNTTDHQRRPFIFLLHKLLELDFRYCLKSLELHTTIGHTDFPDRNALL
jgi:hypothetical protein